MDLWGRGVPLSLGGEERERDMKERGHAIPRLTAVPESTLEMLSSMVLSFVILICVNDTRLPPSRPDVLYLADSLAQPFQV